MENVNEGCASFSAWDTTCVFGFDSVEDRTAVEAGVGDSDWNLDAFNQRLCDIDRNEWKNSCTQISPAQQILRLQDCRLDLEGDDETLGVQTRNNPSWPFEHSPCFFLDLKATKRKSMTAAVLNSSLFDPNFAYNVPVVVSDFGETDTLPHVDVQQEICHMHSISITATPGNSVFLRKLSAKNTKTLENVATINLSERLSDNGCRSDRDTIRSHELVTPTIMNKDKKAATVVDPEARHRLSKSRSKSRDRVDTSRRVKVGSSTSRRAKLDRENKIHLTSSRSPTKDAEFVNSKKLLTREVRRTRSVSVSRCDQMNFNSRTGCKRSSSKKAPPRRHKSSDCLMFEKGDRHVGHSITGMENSSDIQRMTASLCVSSGKDERSVTLKRPKMKRAMSSDQVKPPDDYQPLLTMKSLDSRGEPKRRGRKPSAVSVLKDSSISSVGSDIVENRRPEISEDSLSVGSFSYSDEKSFIEDTNEPITNREPLVGTSDDASESSSSVEGHDHGTQSVYPLHRNLSELLLHNDTVTREDLEALENRKLLHFLMYEHKMGVSIEALKSRIKKELADDPKNALRRRPLVLYVEPA